MEKDLIFEQVNRLVDRVKNKAEGGKEDTLELAKKVSIKGSLAGLSLCEQYRIKD